MSNSAAYESNILDCVNTSLIMKVVVSRLLKALVLACRFWSKSKELGLLIADEVDARDERFDHVAYHEPRVFRAAKLEIRS